MRVSLRPPLLSLSISIDSAKIFSKILITNIIVGARGIYSKNQWQWQWQWQQYKMRQYKKIERRQN